MLKYYVIISNICVCECVCVIAIYRTQHDVNNETVNQLSISKCANDIGHIIESM